jgi:hypothetical protein
MTDLGFAQIELFICNIRTVRYDCIKIKTTYLKKKSGLISTNDNKYHICLTISLPPPHHHHLKQLKMNHLSSVFSL